MSIVFALFAAICLFCYWLHGDQDIRDAIIKHRMEDYGMTRAEAVRFCAFWRGFSLAAAFTYAVTGVLL